MSIRLKNERDLKFLRISGKILKQTLEMLASEVRPGVTLAHLNMLAEAHIKDAGGVPTFLGYTPEGVNDPYPASLCTSVNDVVVHGIPGRYVLKEGDVLSIDLGVTFEGYVTDSAITVGVGKISSDAKKLIQGTKKALTNAIHLCFPGNTLGDIGNAVSVTAKKSGLTIVKGLTGHGVGFELHEDPNVFNFGNPGEGMKLVPGLVIAIEPMCSLGSPYAVIGKDDSFRTKDGSLSAHFEHTVAITEKGYELLTG